ncbi:MAG TPA: RHS repeat-associated core domain-containing protein [Puia sp.]|jgi:RHS repeat-associated protein|nr:RHS repeat-associated core domain-containing protein [Puia sp.]
MEIGYNSTSSVAPGNSYLTPELNGNIEGMVWKGAGSGINRKYDFSYDVANRLTAAAFLQNSSGSSWDKSQVDFSVSGITYDANGNLQTMTQRGFTVGGSSPIDSLSYSYINPDSSNRLSGVADAANNPTSLLEDFHYNSSTKQSTDYAYDGNGNLIKDNNKVIDNMTYNYLNLPQLVHIKGEGNITYTYDAGGNKLSKVISDSIAGLTTTILYIDGFAYQRRAPLWSPTSGADTLEYIGTEEGRARWAYHNYTTGTTGYRFEYDFFERDHLGNTRTVLTQERDTSNYMATMEQEYRTTESQLFGNIAATSVAWSSMPNYTNIPNNIKFMYGGVNDSVSKVDSSSAGGQKVGPNLLLKVMSGDTVNMSVQCYYVSPGGGSTNNSSFSDVLNSLGNALVNLTGGAHGTLSNLTSSGSTVYTGLTSFLNNDDSAHSGYPKAYLNWIFLDDQFNYVSALSGSVVAASSNHPAGSMNLVAPGGPIILNRSGYLYIWVSNETTGWDVFFDNLSLQYKQGPLLEEQHYYPFGLTMAGVSDKAVKTNYTENKYRYNAGTELQNKEFSDGTGLEYYDAGFRRLDPQLGRFSQMDPLSAATDYQTGYQFGGNNPVALNDPTGQLQQDPNTENFYRSIMNQVGGWNDIDEGLEEEDAMAAYSGYVSSMFASVSRAGAAAYWSSYIDQQLYGTSDGPFTVNKQGTIGYDPGDPDNGIAGKHYSMVNGLRVIWATVTFYRRQKLEDGSTPYYHGAQIAININLSGLSYVAYNWIQSINQTGSDQPHLDGHKDDQDNLINAPFYYISTDKNQSWSTWTGEPAAYFSDQPGIKDMNFTWNAQATLVGIDSKGQLTPLASINWGYMVSNGTVWLIPVSISPAPDANTQKVINEYNQKKSSQ